MKTLLFGMRRRLSTLWKKATARRKADCFRPTLEQLEERTLLTIVPPGPVTLQGVDVSHFDGTVDWQAAAASGLSFAYAAASSGTTADATFGLNYAAIKSAGLARGAYQFFRPGQDATAQATMLLQSIGTLGPGDLPPELDVEVTDGQTPSAMVADIQTWLTTVQNATGRLPLIYTSAAFWNGNVGSSTFANYPLWIANWGVIAPNIPSAWPNWAIWQYTPNGSVPGISSAVDRDEFNGSQTDLATFAKANPAFSALASPTIVYGTAMTTFTGHLAAGMLTPPAHETVSVTLNAVTQQATLDSSGNFSARFATAALGVANSPYTVSYNYAGDSNFKNATGGSTLTISKATLTVTAENRTKITGEANPPLTVTYSGFVNGQTLGTSGVTGSPSLTTTATVSSTPGVYAITAGLGTLAGVNYQFMVVGGTLTVLSLAQATTNLVTMVNGAGLPQGTQNSLDSQLQAAIDSFTGDDPTAGANQLGAFIHHVSAQSGKHIDDALADALIAYAQRIINAVR